jgi:putative transposase
MAIEKELLDQLLDGRDPKDFCQGRSARRFEEGAFGAHLSAELDEHLDELESGEGNTNRRNGTSKKSVLTGTSKMTLDIPRDRSGTFDPKLIAKYQAPLPRFRRQDHLDVCARHDGARDPGASRGALRHRRVAGPDLGGHRRGAGRGRGMAERGRSMFATRLFLSRWCSSMRSGSRSATRASSQQGRLHRARHPADGTKEILGIWIEQTEGAKFWLRVMNELKNRGVGDILIAVVDGLKGFPEAITAVFPKRSSKPASFI